MKRSLALAAFFGLLLAPAAVLAHGRGGHFGSSSGSYHPLPTNYAQPLTFQNHVQPLTFQNHVQPLTFQNHVQPKFVNPIGHTPAIHNLNTMHPISNKLVNPKLHLGNSHPIGGPRFATPRQYTLKGSKVLSGKYCCYHRCYPNYCWYGGCYSWPCWCDFSYPLFPWAFDGPIAVAPQPIPGVIGSPADPVGPTEEPLPSPMPVSTAAQDSPGEQQPMVPGPLQFERFLKVKNDTKEKVRFFALFHSKGADGKEAWVPAEPGAPETVYSVEVEPGKALDLTDDDGKPISADRVRIWAASSNRQWLDNETADLWLVPETDAAGNHQYAAAEMQTHTFTVTD